MTDGAHLGVSAGRALKTILGGEPSPSEDEQMDAQQFRDWIKSAPEHVDSSGEDGYTETARLAARYLLEWLEAHPERSRDPLVDEIDMEAARAGGLFAHEGPPADYVAERLKYVTKRGIWDDAAAANPKLHELDLTGFMAGWAFNAARRCIELPPAPNPALLTAEVKQS